MQSSFSDVEYTAKKKQTRRDRFLVEIEAATPWTSLLNVMAPYYPVSGRRGHPPIGLERILRMYIVQQCFGFSDEVHIGVDAQSGLVRAIWVLRNGKRILNCS